MFHEGFPEHRRGEDEERGRQGNLHTPRLREFEYSLCGAFFRALGLFLDRGGGSKGCCGVGCWTLALVDTNETERQGEKTQKPEVPRYNHIFTIFYACLHYVLMFMSLLFARCDNLLTSL